MLCKEFHEMYKKHLLYLVERFIPLAKIEGLTQEIDMAIKQCIEGTTFPAIYPPLIDSDKIVSLSPEGVLTLVFEILDIPWGIYPTNAEATQWKVVKFN